IVKENEPHLALYAGDDGLDCYKEILKNIKPHMKDKCIIAFEIGADQKEDIINLINEYLDNIKIETKKDLSQRDRMIFIFKNIE
ncbi:MAG: protein-(glutamine-N5) methyltransferase, release factor-specific, partial [Bacilli bacterium]|nr:protein-(glutamine-N5) methyltransferase, release factor-specific [Bacilli bacterium]